jgi:hypothetical protein
MGFDLDVLIPTAKNKKHLNTLLTQINTALHCGLNTRVTIGMMGDYPELTERLNPKDSDRIRFIKDAPEGGEVGHRAIKYIFENPDIEWTDWMRYICDDDLATPWGYKHLWGAKDGFSMVVGQALGVSRNTHYDFSHWKLGVGIIFCHVAGSQIIFNRRDLEKLEKPWWDLSRTYDYDFIKRMSVNYPFKIIPNVVDILAFAEFENLGSDFKSQFMNLYGHLV